MAVYFFLNKKAENGGLQKVNWIEMSRVGRYFYLGGGVQVPMQMGRGKRTNDPEEQIIRPLVVMMDSNGIFEKQSVKSLCPLI